MYLPMLRGTYKSGGLKRECGNNQDKKISCNYEKHIKSLYFKHFHFNIPLNLVANR